jgi:glycine oxidase
VTDVAVVGGGTIGLSIAWRARRAGLEVVVVDPEPGRGSSWVAGGMLAPVTEAHFGEDALIRLNLASAERWPAFTRELEAESGRSVGFRAHGTLFVAFDDDDFAFAQDLRRYQEDLGLETQWLTSRQARALEPALAPAVRGALFAPRDNAVHTRNLVEALVAAAEKSGTVFLRSRATSIDIDEGAVIGVTVEGGGTVSAPAVVLAAGSWSSSIAGLPAGMLPPVRPVKGQIIRLASPPSGMSTPFPKRTVRGVVGGHHVYVVPRDDGSLVVGATAEERGFDTTVTGGGVYELLRDAHRLVPGITELVLYDASAGLRPGSPDNAPIVGPPARPGARGLLFATGHYRNGIHLTPITADAVVAHLTGSDPLPELSPFGPDRFGASR